jgi:ribonucleoside-diphosphate reductase alpha chain
MLFQASAPWMTFKDTSNKRYPNIHEGVLHGSNLCTEILLHSKHSKYDSKYGEKNEVGETAVCCLHPVNLAAHVYKVDGKYKVDWNDLRKTIYTGVRALDNIISINSYLTKETEKSALKHRAIGLGTMGWADVYYMLDILQDSDEGAEFAHLMMENFSYDALEASADLASEKGSYSTYKGSLWDQGKLPIDTWNELYQSSDYQSELCKIDYALTRDWDSLRSKVKQGMRNSNVVAIAPTASTAYLAGVEQSIEPSFQMLWKYNNLSGVTPILNPHFSRELKELGLWTKELVDSLIVLDGKVEEMSALPPAIKRKYCSVFSRDMKALVYANACRQKFIDQGISFNIYAASNSKKELVDLYMLCWKLLIKTTYYLRVKPAAAIGTMNSSLADKSLIKNSDTNTSEALTEQQICSLENKEACEMCQ